nr:hypothetical protein [Tanacetum cinerariifolium]
MSGNEDHHRQGHRFAAGGNGHDGRDPHNVKIERLRQQVRDIEIQHKIRHIRKRIRELELQRELTKETGSEPIIWDIGDEEEEYPFVNKYLSLQEPSMLVEEESCPIYDTDNEKESEVIYDTDENAVSTYMVEKSALKTVGHPKPYQFTWLKKRNAIKVSKRCLVEFSAMRKYKDKVW